MVKAKRRRAADQPPPEQSMFWVDSDGEESPRHKLHKDDDDEDFIDLWADTSDDSSDEDEEDPESPNHSTDRQLADFIDLCNSDDEVVEILSDDLDDDELPPLVDSLDDTQVLLPHRQVRNAGRVAARQG
jgi:hypothetical protein